MSLRPETVSGSIGRPSVHLHRTGAASTFRPSKNHAGARCRVHIAACSNCRQALGVDRRLISRRLARTSEIMAVEDEERERWPEEARGGTEVEAGAATAPTTDKAQSAGVR